MESVTGINPKDLDKKKILEMNGKLEQLIQRELIKYANEENIVEYRFLSRFYSGVIANIEWYFLHMSK